MGQPLTATLGGGGGYFGKNNKIFPMYSHGFFGGGFYDNVAYSLSKNLDAGKLMGLSAYGDPCFFQKKYIGTINEMKKMVGGTEGHLVAEHFLKSIPMNQEIKSDDFWSADKLPNSNIANIASSTQKIFMKNVEYMVINAIDFAKKKKFHHHEIIFSGGCALNYPTNSYINSMFGPLFIPPAINDEGLSIGAAITFADNWEKPKNISPLIAYLGPKNKVEPFSYIQTHFSSKVIILSANSEAIKQLAQLLYDGNVAGFYFGRSEIGPRALGHRSIVASPLISKNHSKVNYIKNREEWRPFAPISTINSADKFFYNVKKDSYFMLFNAKAKTKDLPAVTHIDGTSRIQIATTDCGPIYDLLLSFGEISGGYEILLNTSFNDKNEPIVESIDDALNAFLKMDLDYLYLDGLLLKKCQTNH